MLSDLLDTNINFKGNIPSQDGKQSLNMHVYEFQMKTRNIKEMLK